MEHAEATGRKKRRRRNRRRRRKSFLLAPLPGPFMHVTLHFRGKYVAAVNFMPPLVLKFTLRMHLKHGINIWKSIHFPGRFSHKCQITTGIFY